MKESKPIVCKDCGEQLYRQAYRFDDGLMCKSCLYKNHFVNDISKECSQKKQSV